MRRSSPAVAVPALLWPACAAAAPAPLTAGDVLAVAGGLAVVLALLGALAWALGRFAPLRAGRGGSLKVIDSLALSTRERLLLVEVDGERLLLGVSSAGIAALHRARELPGSSYAAAAQRTPAAAGGAR